MIIKSTRFKPPLLHRGSLTAKVVGQFLGDYDGCVEQMRAEGILPIRCVHLFSLAQGEVIPARYTKCTNLANEILREGLESLVGLNTETGHDMREASLRRLLYTRQHHALCESNSFQVMSEKRRGHSRESKYAE